MVKILGIVCLVVNAIMIIGLVHLMGMHAFFHSKGISTFTYITFQRTKNLKLISLKNKEITQEQYDKWLKTTEANLERFKKDSTIKISSKSNT